MRCTRCGHPFAQHTLGAEKKCRTRIAYGWDEKKQTFTKTCPCRCPGYRGADPGICPHDYLKASDKCLYCGHTQASWEKQK
jgi:hypothetical protein